MIMPDHGLDIVYVSPWTSHSTDLWRTFPYGAARIFYCICDLSGLMDTGKQLDLELPDSGTEAVS